MCTSSKGRGICDELSSFMEHAACDRVTCSQPHLVGSSTRMQDEAIATPQEWRMRLADSQCSSGTIRKKTTIGPEFCVAKDSASRIDTRCNAPWTQAKIASLKQYEARTKTHDNAVRAEDLQDSDRPTRVKSFRMEDINASSGGSPRIGDKGGLSEALQTVNHLDQQALQMSTTLLFILLQRCINERDLEAGREVRGLIIKSGLDLDAFLGCHLIRMFAMFGSLLEADEVFQKLSNPNVFTWTAIISAHAKLGQNGQAIKLYDKMCRSSVRPDGHVFVAVLKACTSAGTLTTGKLVHAHVIETGFGSDVFVSNTLVDMYAKCGSIQDSCIIFDKQPNRDVVTWNALIAGCTQHGHDREAIQAFQGMQQEGIKPNKVTYVSILKACSSIAALEQGKWIHAYIVESRLELDLSVGNALIDLYGKCGSLDDALMVFETLSTRDVVTWTALITGYSMHGHGQEAVKLFLHMQLEGIEPDGITYFGVLKACDNAAALELGKLIHARIVGSGLDIDVFVGSCVLDMYCRCGSLNEACTVLDRMPIRDLVTWSALISGFAQLGYGEEALQISQQMQQEGMEPDQVTFVCMLKACSSILALEQGKQMHASIIVRRFESDLYVSNALVDMYGKCGSLHDAHMIFDSSPARDVVTWSALIGGYAHNGHGQEALQLFQQMQQESMEPNRITFVCILKACSSVAALEQGRWIHAHTVERGFQSDVFICNTLIDMYSKCGSLEDACAVFSQSEKQDIVTWNSLIVGYALHSDYSSAFYYFKNMQQAGLKPNDVTFIGLISACSHAGLLDAGCLIFKSMRGSHHVVPALEHYDSLVDLLGQTGRLEEAEDLLETIHFKDNTVGWVSLLSSCRKHGNVDVASRCFDKIVTMDCRNSASYVLMSRIYAHAGLQEDADKVEALRRNTSMWKKPAKAFIEIDNLVHDFIVDDRTHPRSCEIYAKLNDLNRQMRKKGYAPCLDSVLEGVEKEDALCGHSERLAIAFGLICTPRGMTIRVAKNLRVCADCHTVTKIISKIEMREIVVSDAYRIHHFKDGACSCNDYY